ncbi:presenilin-like aspartic peptidase, putative [Trypanosoma equiperdum]|uniref:Presenilin n=2 Tax=Trypanozoon TaxID=39700 RepID=Q38F54_TRYB2|nr:presenilin-like aspartic peptidase, putative [Trypanosoma brucei brucei TREU927]EAN76566.1 presenilin-like aspartic peptidase, putative [Trypanosoma brucei brucei TREU927]SCU68324.1 presenilin-like aspartic peptidase, putative [Trypanosoma equiperdum]
MRRSRVPADGVSHILGKRAVALLVPVLITLMLVTWSVLNLSSLIGERQNSLVIVEPYGNESSSLQVFEASVINALAVVALIVVFTFIMLALYKFGFEIVLYVWLGVSVGSILFITMWVFLDLVLTRFQIPYDFITMFLVLWNTGVVGLVSIFYYSHPTVAQVYLIAISVIVAWSATSLPAWTTWCLLVAVAIYDVVAVLCPYGPLRMLVEAADERNRPIPALVYDSDARIIVATSFPGEDAQMVEIAARARKQEGGRQRPRKRPPSPLDSLLGDTPFKLGLGDFIFYSLLCGIAASYSFIPWLMSVIAVLFGLVGTLLFLVLFKEKLTALPALPISIALGVITYFSSRYLVVPLDWFATLSVLAL